MFAIKIVNYRELKEPFLFDQCSFTVKTVELVIFAIVGIGPTKTTGFADTFSPTVTAELSRSICRPTAVVVKRSVLRMKEMVR